jgi:hypothetical protein
LRSEADAEDGHVCGERGSQQGPLGGLVAVIGEGIHLAAHDDQRVVLDVGGQRVAGVQPQHVQLQTGGGQPRGERARVLARNVLDDQCARHIVLS